MHLKGCGRKCHDKKKKVIATFYATFLTTRNFDFMLYYVASLSHNPGLTPDNSDFANNNYNCDIYTSYFCLKTT